MDGPRVRKNARVCGKMPSGPPAPRDLARNMRLIEVDRRTRVHGERAGNGCDPFKPDDVAAGRAYIKAYVEFIHFVEFVYDSTMNAPHGHFEERDVPAKQH